MNYIAGCINTSQEMKKVVVQLPPYITIMSIIEIATIRHQCHSWPSKRLLQMSMGPKLKLKVSVVSGDMYMKDLHMLKHHKKICTLQGPRLETLMTVLDFFTSWERFCKVRKGGDKSKKGNFITAQSFWDLKSSILGFLEFCKMTIPDQPVSPCIVNIDICENIFCQQRTMYSGANTNPDVFQYRCVNYFHMSTNHGIFYYSTTAIVLTLSAWKTQSR